VSSLDGQVPKFLHNKAITIEQLDYVIVVVAIFEFSSTEFDLIPIKKNLNHEQTHTQLA